MRNKSVQNYKCSKKGFLKCSYYNVTDILSGYFGSSVTHSTSQNNCVGEMWQTEVPSLFSTLKLNNCSFVLFTQYTEHR